MSDREVEHLLSRARAGETYPVPEGIHLTRDEGLARRDAGNLPDDQGRALRLVLHLERRTDPQTVHQKRLLFEPDFHSAPTWRREGSRPVNVIPLGLGPTEVKHEAWWDDEEMAGLEAQWSSSGIVEGIKVPASYRSFVYKTIVTLRRDGHEVSALSVADSIARWLPEREAEALRESLTDAKEPGSDEPGSQT
jgi:hypothetical protein